MRRAGANHIHQAYIFLSPFCTPRRVFYRSSHAGIRQLLPSPFCKYLRKLLHHLFYFRSDSDLPLPKFHIPEEDAGLAIAVRLEVPVVHRGGRGWRSWRRWGDRSGRRDLVLGVLSAEDLGSFSRRLFVWTTAL